MSGEISTRSEFLIVAKRLMETEKRPMSAREIVDLAQAQQLFSDNIAGKTPYQTMKSKLCTQIRRYGENSLFVRTAPGRFYLRHLLNGGAAPFDTLPLRPPNSQERVLAYKAAELDKITDWQGLMTNYEDKARQIFSNLQPYYLPRFDVERDDSFTQILTYILVSKGDELLSYRRGTYNRVDKFLQGALCVGFGGHVIDADRDLFSGETMGVVECAIRELAEELYLPPSEIQRANMHENMKLVGIINDDSSDVGRRHLAFVMRYNTSNDQYWNQPKRGEKAITQLRWISTKEPGRSSLWQFEYWSQLCIREFVPDLALARPAFKLIRRNPLKPPHVLLIIGPVGSGKTLATDVLKQDFGYTEINTGCVVAQILGIPPVSSTPRQEFQEKAWAFINTPTGPSVLAGKLLELINESTSERILIDGIRQKETLECLRRMSGTKKIGVVFVHTPADQAYGFYSARILRGATMEQFLAARNADVEREVEGLIMKADAVLYNWTGKLLYRETIMQLMNEIGVLGENNK